MSQDGVCRQCGAPTSKHDGVADLGRLRAMEHDPGDSESAGVFLNNKTLGEQDFSGLRVRGLDISNSQLGGSSFANSCLGDLRADSAMLESTDWSEARVCDATFVEADLRAAKLVGTDMRMAEMRRVDARGAMMMGTDLRGTKLVGADLRGADLRGCRLDTRTDITGARLEEVRIDRLNAEVLTDLGLRRAALLTMDIEDDVAKLRLSFSGPWRTLHFAGIIIFVLPYLWFIIGKLVAGALVCTSAESQCRSLSTSLLEFIVGRGGWPAMATFVALLVYNVARSLLLLKVVALEHLEVTTGLPPRFVLSGAWLWLYKARVLAGINVALVAWHTHRMLEALVPT